MKVVAIAAVAGGLRAIDSDGRLLEGLHALVDGGDAAPEVGPGATAALAHGADGEAGVGDHLRERGLGREAADALDEVLV